MTEQQITAAWNEQPFPLDLPENEQAAYIALTMIYRHYRENVLTRKQAQLFKEQLTDWAHCPPMERAAQLQYALANEWARGRNGADVWENLRILFIEYGMLLHQRFIDG